jgi:hypothetical protein
VIAARRLAPRGAVTRHPLPAPDTSLAALSAEERATGAAVWHGRAEAERRASGSFAHVAGALARLGAPDELCALAARAVDDEVRHAAICAEVARAFGERGPVRRLPVTIPRHAGASPALRDLLHVIGMCALNETCGSSFLALCREGTTGALAGAALRELLSDEIDHARLGWAVLAAQDRATRAAVAAWMPALVGGTLRMWRRRPHRAITPALVAHGCPAWDDVDRAVLDAMRDLVLPGLDAAGVDPAPARAALSQLAAA